MFKNLFRFKKDKISGSRSRKEGRFGAQESSLFAETLPPKTSEQELLNSRGRLICKVLFQVMRRSGLNIKDFTFLVEFANPAKHTFRVLADMPLKTALGHVECKEIEHTAMIELDMRHEIRLVSMFWRIKDTDDSSMLLSGFSPLSDLGLDARTNNNLKKTSYPPPVRITSPPTTDEGLFVSTDREATPSELMEFQNVLRLSSASFVTSTANGAAQVGK